jgi:hypothetical protein
MERDDEDPSQAREDAAADEGHGQRWLAESNRSDGEALALHEI